jgi:hypothetical protein
MAFLLAVFKKVFQQVVGKLVAQDRLGSVLSHRVDNEEHLARFLTSSRHFNSTMVKPAAFLPKDEETSVYRHGAEPRVQLWQIAEENLRLREEQKCHGAAIIKAYSVRMSRLDVIAEEPPPRHANIKGWPLLDDQAMQRAKHIEIAQELADNAVLIKRNA